MVQALFTDSDGKIKETNIEDYLKANFDLSYKWIRLINPSDKEIEDLYEKTQIPLDYLKAALDDEERARIEKDDGATLVIYDIPVSEKDDNDSVIYSTMPLAIILKDKYIVTVCLQESGIIKDFAKGKIKGVSTAFRERFLFQIMFNTAKRYLSYLKQIDKASQRIQNKLHKSTKNKELIQLLDLENALVYFSTSLSSNEAVIMKMINATNLIKGYPDDKDLLEDLLIETKQAIAMCNIYKDILSGTMDAFASIISNNQNIVIKMLTIITIIISIPTVVSSFFGMNVPVPLADKRWAFWVIALLSFIVAGIAGFFLLRKRK